MLVTQPHDADVDARCPKCANTHGIRDGGPSLSGMRAYDIMHDTYGLLRCPFCGHRAGRAEFRKAQNGTEKPSDF